MQTKIFKGHLYQNAARRQFRTIDPANGRNIVSNEEFHLLKGCVVDEISGYGQSKGTTEAYVTLSGQYDHFTKARLTIGGEENVKALKDFLVARKVLNMEAQNAKHIPFKTDVVFDATVKSMLGRSRGYNSDRGWQPGQRVETNGYTVKELWAVNEDGTTTPIFTIPSTDAGAEEAKTTDEKEEAFL